MDQELRVRLDALIEVLNRIERRLGQIAGPARQEAGAPVRDPSLRGVVRAWAEELAIAVSAADIDGLLDSVQWDGKRLRVELQRLSSKQAAQPARSLRRLLASR